MILVDSALEAREREGRPIRVGMAGAGFMGRGIALQIATAVRGMRLSAIYSRRLEAGLRAFKEAGIENVRITKTAGQLEDAVRAGDHAVTQDPRVLAEAQSLDALIEVTGTVEFGARFVLRAIEHRKHVIMMNAELDGTVGPILRVHAEAAGVVLTNAGGDQPGVTMDLFRFVRGIGVKPLLCGNIKGLHDPYRNPTTQRNFAERWGQNAYMVTAFADGTKISFEQAIVANATGMAVARRGMYGPTVPPGTPLEEAIKAFPLEEILERGGIVDYLVGATPGPGVFVLGTHDHPVQRQYLNLYKLGDGPLYCFYAPYHLCHFEVPNSVARAVLFGDPTIASLGGPLVDVVATAKVDLEAGQVLDRMGGYRTYGQCENTPVARAERLLPMGVSEGCRLRRAVPRDHVLTYDDVELPAGRFGDALRAEQDAYFASSLSMV